MTAIPASGFRPSALLLALATALALAPACAGSSGTGGDGDGDGDGPVGPIDFPLFVQDRHAIGGDWYLYDEEGGHALTPFDHAYLFEDRSGDEVRYGAVRIDTYYDTDTAESGVFTFRFKTWNGTAWSGETEHVSSKNIKSAGPVCFDLFAGAEVDCAGTSWQLTFRIYRFLVRTGPIVVARPGLFLRQAPLVDGGAPIRAATLETTTGLESLPDPTTVPALDDVAPAGWGDPGYDLARWAPNLPEAGRVLGARFVDDGFAARPDVYFLLNAGNTLFRFTVVPVADGDPSAGLSFTVTGQDVDRQARTVPAEVPEARTVTVAAPAAGAMTFIDLDAADLALPASLLADIDPPDHAPAENEWELALEWQGDRLELLVSSGAALYNATALDDEEVLMEATPPL